MKPAFKTFVFTRILILALLLLCITVSYSQKTYNLDAPKTEAQLIGKATKTSDFAIYKTIKYPVYISEKGKMFIVYKNIKGNYSKKYLQTTSTSTSTILPVSLNNSPVINNSYSQGWEDGYCAGWKDIKGNLAICPIAPIAPLPKINQSTYQDGHNRGFLAGRKAASK
jgi:hypothetical protein